MNHRPDQIDVAVSDRLCLGSVDAVVRRYQRHALIDATAHLRGMWEREPEAQTKHQLAIACTITAHAACESILNEWAHLAVRTVYRKASLKWSLVERAECFAALIGRSFPADLRHLSTAKNALAHSMPDEDRTREVVSWVEGDGAARAARVVQLIDETFFPLGPPASAMP
jgi:hypothetical protein